MQIFNSLQTDNEKYAALGPTSNSRIVFKLGGDVVLMKYHM